MNVVFVEPFFPPTQRHFVRALAEAGANVIGIGEYPAEALDDQLRGWMSHYDRIPSVVDTAVLADAVRQVQARLWVDRLEATIEAHMLPVAQVREACAIPGTSVRTAWLCRDGRKVIAALGIGTSATHMEWFFGPKGLRFSEIGCRPPGVGAWDLYSAGNDLDVYREWAGIVALRPDHDGRITGYSGADDVQARHGEWVLDAHLPPAGTPTQPVAAGYMANAYVRMRHPDYDVLRGMLDDVGRTVHVHAG